MIHIDDVKNNLNIANKTEFGHYFVSIPIPQHMHRLKSFLTRCLDLFPIEKDLVQQIY